MSPPATDATMSPPPVDDAACSLSGSVAAVTERRLPPFWPHDVDLWFIQAETIFAAGRITSETTRYGLVVSALDRNALRQVRGLLTRPPTATPYSDVKAALLEYNELNADQRLEALTSTLTLGDQRPSQLLDNMLSMGKGLLPDEQIRSLWIKRLPISLQGPLMLCYQPLSIIGREADRMLTSLPSTYPVAPVQPPPTSAARATSSASTASAGIGELLTALTELLRDKPRTSTSKPTKPADTCFYHWKFGDQAKNCQQPCKFAPKNF